MVPSFCYCTPKTQTAPQCVCIRLCPFPSQRPFLCKHKWNTRLRVKVLRRQENEYTIRTCEDSSSTSRNGKTVPLNRVTEFYTPV